MYGSIAVAIAYNPISAVGLASNDCYCHTMKIIAVIATCLQIPMNVAMFFSPDSALTEDKQVDPSERRITLGENKIVEDEDKDSESDEKVLIEPTRS